MRREILIRLYATAMPFRFDAGLVAAYTHAQRIFPPYFISALGHWARTYLQSFARPARSPPAICLAAPPSFFSPSADADSGGAVDASAERGEAAAISRAGCLGAMGREAPRPRRLRATLMQSDADACRLFGARHASQHSTCGHEFLR